MSRAIFDTPMIRPRHRGRRDGQRDVDQATIFADAHGLEMIYALAPLDTREDVVFLGLPIGGDEDAHGRPTSSAAE